MEKPAPRNRQLSDEVEPTTSSDPARPKDWVDELIAMTRPGIDMELPDRAFIPRVPTFVFDDFD